MNVDSTIKPLNLLYNFGGLGASVNDSKMTHLNKSTQTKNVLFESTCFPPLTSTLFSCGASSEATLSCKSVYIDQ